MIQLGDFFSPEAGQARTRWLNDKFQDAYDTAEYYLGPTGIPQRVMAMGHALNFTDAGDMPEAARASRELWNNPSLEAATDYLGAGIALGVPVLSARMINDGVDVLGSAVDDVMAGYDPTRLNAILPGRTADDMEAALRDKYPGLNVSIGGNADRGYTVNKIVAPERGQGVGTAAMTDIVDTADAQGARVALTPSKDFGGSVPRLRDFYKRFGFVDNSGRNKDFEISEGMYREARDPATTRGQEILDLLSTNPSAVTDDMLDMGDPVLNARLNEYLWNNYDLPMDEASRMTRAEGMGFDAETPLYHGTAADVAAFDRARVGQNFGSSGDYGAGYYTTGQTGNAAKYAEHAARQFGANDPNVMPLRTSGQYMPIDYRGVFENDLRDMVGLEATPEEITDRLTRTLGVDGVEVWKPRDYRYGREVGPREVIEEKVTFDPTNIRSRFARFDPRLAHLRNLNAGLAGIMMGGMALTPSDEAELETYLDGI